MHEGLSSDVYWHLAAGKWMLAHHSVVRHDVFSYTIFGRTWTDGEWGFEVVLAFLDRTIGPLSFWIISAGPCIAALLAGIARWRRIGASWLWTGMIAIGAGGCLALGEASRPQSLSYLFFAAELLVLTLARRRARWLACLPPLFVVWANVHGSFLAGLAVLLLDVALSFWPFERLLLRVSQPLARRAAAMTFAGSVLATLINPHGPLLLSYELHVSTSSQLAALIEEWQSPDFHSVVLLVLVIGPALVLLFALAISTPTIEAFDLLLWVGFLLASLHAQRFIPYLGLAWGGLGARLPILRRETLRPTLVTWPLSAVLVLCLLVGAHVPAGTPAGGGGATGMPVAAARWLDSRSGRVFSTYWWNDYLVYVGIPVFVDGRTDLYFGTNILDQWVKIDALTVDPDVLLQRWDVRYVLWPESSPLAVFLSHDRSWRLAYQSGASLVFEHVDA